MHREQLLALLLALLFAALSAQAQDTVTLVSGERVRGEFVSADHDLVRITVDGEERALERRNVVRIVFAQSTGANADLSRAKLVVETGFAIEARLRTALSSHVSRNGERFEAELLTPIVASSGEVMAAAGDTIWGRVVHAQRRQPPATRGVLDVELSEVRMLGRMRIIKTTLGQFDEGNPDDAASREQHLRPGAVIRFNLAQPVTIRASRF